MLALLSQPRARYQGARIALLTQHGKEKTIAPLFSESLGAAIEHVSGFDTDSLGTFTREVRRFGSQRDAAREKARIGLALSGLPFALASEGSVGGALLGLVPWDVECVLFVDTHLGIEIAGRAGGPALNRHALVETPEELSAFASQAGFPEHALVVRPDGPDDPRIRKGLREEGALREAFVRALGESQRGAVFVENDMRAHMNPTRMKLIEAATRDLLDRIASDCPSCGAPGFGAEEAIAGLPCSVCLTPTEETLAYRWRCVACRYSSIRDRPEAGLAGPSSCPACNP